MLTDGSTWSFCLLRLGLTLFVAFVLSGADSDGEDPFPPDEILSLGLDVPSYGPMLCSRFEVLYPVSSYRAKEAGRIPL